MCAGERQRAAAARDGRVSQTMLEDVRVCEAESQRMHERGPQNREQHAAPRSMTGTERSEDYKRRSVEDEEEGGLERRNA